MARVRLALSNSGGELVATTLDVSDIDDTEAIGRKVRDWLDDKPLAVGDTITIREV